MQLQSFMNFACSALIASWLSHTALAQQSPPPEPAAQPAATPATPPPEQAIEDRPHSVHLLRMEASKLLRLTQTPDAKRFLLNTNWLPVVENTSVWTRKEPRSYLSPAQYEALPQADRAAYEEQLHDDYFFYYTRYGSPLAYTRAIDLVATAWNSQKDAPSVFENKRIMDFGFGGIGQLRMLGNMGAHVVGIEVDPLLEALYASPTLTGEVTRASVMDDVPPVGSLKLLYGKWPADATIKEAAGDKLDLFISKNTLKRGYITPDQEVDPRRLVQLGVTPEEFVQTLAQSMNPGGLVMIYNICPKPAPEGEPYKPWADGRCPFSRESLEAAGFEVLAYDQDDTEGMKPYAKALDWDAGNNPMDLENDFVVLYTLLKKKAD
jgi:hypothetical protein